MPRLWMLVVLAPLALALRAEPVPAQQDVQIQLKAVANGNGGANKENGNLYYVAISQEDQMDFLVHGFEKAIKDNCKSMFREIQGQLLKGNLCTKQKLLETLEDLVGKAKADDVVMLFIACHGSCNPKSPTGESVFSTRKGTVRPREIKAILGKLPCQAIVMNDACCSGNWPKDLPGDPMPGNISAMCCCQYNQGSVIQFDVTLFEGLYGRADFNKDGVVDLDELLKYCESRIREVEGGTLIPTVHKAKNLTRSLPLTKANPDLVGVVHGREVFTGVVEKKDGDSFDVYVLGYAPKGMKAGYTGNRLKHNYSRPNIILPGDGAALMVKAEGKGWVPACLVSKQNDSYKVRFVGGETGEATVTGENVRHLFAGNPSESFPPNLFTGGKKKK